MSISAAHVEAIRLARLNRECSWSSCRIPGSTLYPCGFRCAEHRPAVRLEPVIETV